MFSDNIENGELGSEKKPLNLHLQFLDRPADKSLDSWDPIIVYILCGCLGILCHNFSIFIFIFQVHSRYHSFQSVLSLELKQHSL